jgi:hypothetical protein
LKELVIKGEVIMAEVSIREMFGIDVDGSIEEQDEDERFNAICERYRTMMKANEGKSFEERRDAINNFRAGRF